VALDGREGIFVRTIVILQQVLRNLEFVDDSGLFYPFRRFGDGLGARGAGALRRSAGARPTSRPAIGAAYETRGARSTLIVEHQWVRFEVYCAS
jgi:hypothetical protein